MVDLTSDSGNNAGADYRHGAFGTRYTCCQHLWYECAIAWWATGQSVASGWVAFRYAWYCCGHALFLPPQALALGFSSGAKASAFR